MDRAPQVDYLDAAAQQLLGVVAQQVAHPLRTGFCGVVDMDARRGLGGHARLSARRPRHAAALHVIEDEDAAGPRHLGDEPLGLGEIDLVNFVFVPEVAHCGALLDERETVPLEGDVRRNRPHIVNAHRVRLVRHIGRRIGAGVIGEIARPLGHRHEIIEFALDKAQGVRCRHGLLLLSSSGKLRLGYRAVAVHHHTLVSLLPPERLAAEELGIGVG
jgi:hypothetical protein